MEDTIKVALLDVDGTLRHKGQWNPGGVELVAHLVDAGVRVALCSGRSPGSMKNLVQEFPDVTLLGCSSGSTALARSDGDWRVLGHRPIPSAHVNEALRCADENGIEVWGFTESTWYAPERTDFVTYEESFVGEGATIAPLEGRDDLGKVLFMPRSREHEEAIRELQHLDGMAVVMSGHQYADLIPAESAATKGGDFILDQLGVGWDGVLAIGDGENDLGMLGRARWSVAVAPLRANLIRPREGAVRHQAADTAAALEVVRTLLG